MSRDINSRVYAASYASFHAMLFSLLLQARYFLR